MFVYENNEKKLIMVNYSDTAENKMQRKSLFFASKSLNREKKVGDFNFSFRKMAKICIICCSPCTDYTRDDKHFLDSNGGEEDSIFHHEFQQARQIFETFCEYLDVKLDKDCRWNYLKESLPFCPSCKEITEYMFQLHNQLQSIQNELKCCVENVRLKIQDSSDNLKSSEMLESCTIDKRISILIYMLRKPTAIENSTLTNEVEGPNVAQRAQRRSKQRIKYTEEIQLESDSEAEVNRSSTQKEEERKLSDVDFEGSDGDDSSDEDYKAKVKGDEYKGSQGEKKTHSKPRPVTKTKDGFMYEGHKFKQIPQGFECCGCSNKVFKRKGGILVHIRQVHLGEISRHVCDLCGRACDSPFALRNHRSTHFHERNFPCHCGKAFKNGKNLKRHIVETHKLNLKVKDDTNLKSLHTQEQTNRSVEVDQSMAYYCDTCGKGFDQQNNLQDHLLGHAGEKYFKCFYCSTNYLQKENLQRHLSKEHTIKVTESTLNTAS